MAAAAKPPTTNSTSRGMAFCIGAGVIVGGILLAPIALEKVLENAIAPCLGSEIVTFVGLQALLGLAMQFVLALL
jgi:hypothetical protein